MLTTKEKNKNDLEIILSKVNPPVPSIILKFLSHLFYLLFRFLEFLRS